jgi:hypothetical protein
MEISRIDFEKKVFCRVNASEFISNMTHLDGIEVTVMLSGMTHA